MEARQLRDKANEALSKGRFARAAELFEQYCQQEPKDFQSRVRLGDAWAKEGDKRRAISAYHAAAEGFAHEGFLPRAIAASKLILELDPSHQGVQQMLANLYAQRGGGKGGSHAPPRPTVARPVEPPPAAAPVRTAMYIDLPPEVDEALAEDAPPTPPPPPPDSETPSEEIEVELDLGEAESAPAPAAEVQPPRDEPTRLAMAHAAPPGMRRRTGEFPAVQVPPPAPPEQPTAPRSVAAPPAPSRVERFVPPDAVDFEPPVPDSTSFTELAIEADSLLHAVELAALAGAKESAAPEAAVESPEAAAPVHEEAVSEPHAAEGALPQIPLFSDLPRDAFIALFERCPLRRFSEGQVILEQGSQGNAFYVICAGKVRIVRQTGGEQRELAVLGEGAFFGEMALLSGAPRSASVLGAAEETQVLEISAPVLGELSRHYPQVARALRRFCRQRMLSQVVNSSALFVPFGRKDRRELVERFRAREVRRGEVIIHEGQSVDGLYVVLSGEVAVSKEGQGLARLGEGELFGEMSLLQKTPATATVTAVRNTSLLRLPREDFDSLILTHPQVLVLVSELTEARQRSNDARFGTAPPPAEPGGETFEDLVLF